MLVCNGLEATLVEPMYFRFLSNKERHNYHFLNNRHLPHKVFSLIPMISQAEFSTKPPLDLPCKLSDRNIKNLLSTMTVYNMRPYQLGGCTFNTGGHFVAILLWHGKLDGIKSTKQQQLVECSPHLLTNLENCTEWILCILLPFIHTFFNLLALSLLTLYI